MGGLNIELMRIIEGSKITQTGESNVFGKLNFINSKHSMCDNLNSEV